MEVEIKAPHFGATGISCQQQLRSFSDFSSLAKAVAGTKMHGADDAFLIQDDSWSMSLRP